MDFLGELKDSCDTGMGLFQYTNQSCINGSRFVMFQNILI